MNKVRIGHPAYSGVNDLAYANSKAAAINILRDRGCTRDKAREVVNDVLKKDSGYRTIYTGNGFDVIEVWNDTKIN